MKKILNLFVILLTCLFVLCGCNKSENTNDSSYSSDTEKLSNSTSIPKKELDVSSFSTKILDQTPNRVDNIALTCSKINNITIKSGEVFSFCDTVGEVSADTGYKEADVLDAQRKTF